MPHHSMQSNHGIATAYTIATILRASSLEPLESRMLVMHVLKKNRIQLITQSEYVLTPDELQRVLMLFSRREQGEPIAYLTGERGFFGLSLHVTPDVLIPRPDTELLVELALHYAPPNSVLLDMGTGSGAIALAVATQRPDVQVWASDVSEAALVVAQKNATAHQCAIHFSQSDWYQDLADQTWHTIVSNPPYIVQHDPHLSQGDLRFEPINALTDHADGLSAYRILIAGAPKRLLCDGWLLLEHGYDQAAAVTALFSAHGFTQVQSWPDLNGILRVSGGCWSHAS